MRMVRRTGEVLSQLSHQADGHRDLVEEQPRSNLRRGTDFTQQISVGTGGA